ncbi:hypothetical protein IQ254_29570 [Nodosilinea sp. LEGE 07088]|uniref:hypothetical protein n=1 Tax=Nodosilinea sp. LEGE 07088 TaxID=2777968 RepID=UPI001881A83F|nr:hypothetical protein [Nodosilinea sp. LEGE 07088]MBE9141292.1 hypothetical protein [Nodosilinea sp. LEGE 07088]
MFQTEFEFTLPKGYLDGEGNLHRTGLMRLAKAEDEIAPLQDPRVHANPAYATVLILARVITKLGALDNINARIIENLYASDLSYLYQLYCTINEFDRGDKANNGALPLHLGIG